THSWSLNAPAPTGSLLNAAPFSCNALGEPMNVRAVVAMDRSSCGFGLANVIDRVNGSTTVVVIARAAGATATVDCGAAVRSQLNFTAAESNGVPSLNFTPSRSFSVHVVPPSVLWNDCATR